MLKSYFYLIISLCGLFFLFFLYFLYYLRKRYLSYLQRKVRKKWKNAHYNSLRGNFVVIYDSPIEDQYEIEKELILGQGSFGIVVVGKNKETGIKYAIKFIHKSSDESKRLEREVKLLKDVDHINIVGLFAVYETIEQVGFVMELCTGGHLGRFLEKMPGHFLQEDHSKGIIRQLLSAIAHMHARGICHRDIKLQNILMENQSINSQIKLIDFGFGTRFIGATPLKTRCGTPYTTAPEVFQESYDERCDVWSAGVVAYTIICGKRPFQALVIPGELENAAKTTLITNILMCRYFIYYQFCFVYDKILIYFCYFQFICLLDIILIIPNGRWFHQWQLILFKRCYIQIIGIKFSFLLLFSFVFFSFLSFFYCIK